MYSALMLAAAGVTLTEPGGEKSICPRAGRPVRVRAGACLNGASARRICQDVGIVIEGSEA